MFKRFCCPGCCAAMSANFTVADVVRCGLCATAIALDPGGVRRVAEKVSEAATKGATRAVGKGENRGW